MPGPAALPLKFDAEASAAEILKAQALAKAAVDGLGWQDNPGRIAHIEDERQKRNGRAMDAAELSRLDVLLESRWGDKHADRVASVRAAFDRMGEGGAWFRQRLMESGPVTCALIFDSIPSVKD